jgi:hypothetical protein
MRIIVILAAASITFVATLPLSTSANAVTAKQCQAAYDRCISPPLGLRQLRCKWGAPCSWTRVDGDQCKAELDNCTAMWKGAEKYNRPKQKARADIRRSAAGLLETGPGFSSQGPAATGTPSAPAGGSSGSGGSLRGSTYSR